MSTRFYAGPISSGMGRSCEDWTEPERGIEAQLRRRRPAVQRLHHELPVRAAPLPDSHHSLVDPIAPRR
ncbi:MAG: hypothetical protein ABI781_14190 [Burkholderiales bacterium]